MSVTEAFIYIVLAHQDKLFLKKHFFVKLVNKKNNKKRKDLKNNKLKN